MKMFSVSLTVWKDQGKKTPPVEYYWNKNVKFTPAPERGQPAVALPRQINYHQTREREGEKRKVKGGWMQEEKLNQFPRGPLKVFLCQLVFQVIEAGLVFSNWLTLLKLKENETLFLPQLVVRFYIMFLVGGDHTHIQRMLDQRN